MDDRELRLRCLEAAEGDLFIAKRNWHWVDGLEEEILVAQYLYGEAE